MYPATRHGVGHSNSTSPKIVKIFFGVGFFILLYELPLNLLFIFVVVGFVSPSAAVVVVRVVSLFFIIYFTFYFVDCFTKQQQQQQWQQTRLKAEWEWLGEG